MCKWSRNEVELAAGLGAALGALDDCFEGADDPRNQERNPDIFGVFRAQVLPYRFCYGVCVPGWSSWIVTVVVELGCCTSPRTGRKRVGARGNGHRMPGFAKQNPDLEVRDHLYGYAAGVTTFCFGVENGDKSKPAFLSQVEGKKAKPSKIQTPL